jgi:DNA-binding response OmpR family regulator
VVGGVIVEDDWDLNQSMGYVLEKEGYAVKGVHSIGEAMEFFAGEDFHMVLLDVNLPDGEGFGFCQWVKERRDTKVLFLTARDLEEDALKGYEKGADDYVTKPFSMKVLLKKIHVILRRTVEPDKMIWEDGFLRIDLERAKIEVAGVLCSVTPTEFRLLQEFISHRGQLLTYGVLLERLWDMGGQFVDKHALAVNVNRLRGKIEDEQHKYITNIYGMGYQWVD